MLERFVRGTQIRAAVDAVALVVWTPARQLDDPRQRPDPNGLFAHIPGVAAYPSPGEPASPSRSDLLERHHSHIDQRFTGELQVQEQPIEGIL